MEKPSNYKPKASVNIFHFLSKPTSLVSIPHPPYSPGRENTCTNTTKSLHNNKGFLIPVEARARKDKSSSGADEEPTSPKVSCTGQIKRKKKKKKQQQQQQQHTSTTTSTSTSHADRRENYRGFSVRRMLIFRDRNRKSRPRRAADGSENTNRVRVPTAATETAATAVGEMRRLTSGRSGAAALRGVDWEKVEREMKLDKENGGGGGGGGDEVVKEPRKEVNLWKRRAMASRPTPLEVL